MNGKKTDKNDLPRRNRSSDLCISYGTAGSRNHEWLL